MYFCNCLPSVGTVTPFATALHDHHFEELQGPLRIRDGERTEDHPIEGYYFADYEGDDGVLDAVEGPLLDIGAGAGRHALALQERFETTAIEPNEKLVEVMRGRGVEDAHAVDMFDLRDAFDPGTFRSAIIIGTQVGLARSIPGLRAFLDDLDHVTTADATVVLDGYDPDHERTTELIGYRESHDGETAYRVLQFEYDGSIGRPWLFQLFSPDDVERAAQDTVWDVTEVTRGQGDWAHTYNIVLEKTQ